VIRENTIAKVYSLIRIPPTRIAINTIPDRMRTTILGNFNVFYFLVQNFGKSSKNRDINNYRTNNSLFPFFTKPDEFKESVFFFKFIGQDL